MALELCEMALQQTQELLRLTDQTLQRIGNKQFDSKGLYPEMLERVLGGMGKRGPLAVLIVSQQPGNGHFLGNVYHLLSGKMVSRSGELIIEHTSSYARNLELTESQTEVMAVNWIDGFESVEEFQRFFHPAIVEAVGGAIKNFVVSRISGNSHRAIISFNYPGKATDYDADVLRSLAVLIGSLTALSEEVQETERAFIYTIEALARACEAAEEDTGRHIIRVNRYAGALAANMGLPADFVTTIAYSAQMHDVGKIRIPPSILLKKGALTEDEVGLIKMHPAYGEKILGTSPRMRIAREIAIAHHENWDGSGYPYGLKGEEIPLAGRIVKVADVYDALRSKRSYKKAFSHETAMEIMHSGDEKVLPAHFDPAILAVLFKIEQMFESIYTSSEYMEDGQLLS